MSTLLGRAIAIAADAFQNVTDRGGQPYILHCLFVMDQMPANDHDLRCIAVLHDLLEDRGDQWSVERLMKEGFNDRVISALKLLTHAKDVSYDDYIEQLTVNYDAVQVKRADLRHNSDILRLKGVRKKDLERIEKYFKAYARLQNITG